LSATVDIDKPKLVEYMKVMLFQQEQQLEVAVARMEPEA